MIKDKKILEGLFEAFQGSFINSQFEFIADEKTNLYFILGNCENELDVKCKVLEWFSRDAYKSMPFRSAHKNEEYHKRILQSINKFLGTKFTMEEIGKIYDNLGNAINHEKTKRFVESGYETSILKEE